MQMGAKYDHIHANNPDLFFPSVMLELGWEDYCVEYTPDNKAPLVYEIPETTVENLCEHLKSRLKLKTTRVIGKKEAVVSIVIHVCPIIGITVLLGGGAFHPLKQFHKVFFIFKAQNFCDFSDIFIGFTQEFFCFCKL